MIYTQDIKRRLAYGTCALLVSVHFVVFRQADAVVTLQVLLLDSACISFEPSRPALRGTVCTASIAGETLGTSALNARFPLISL